MEDLELKDLIGDVGMSAIGIVILNIALKNMLLIMVDVMLKVGDILL